MKSSGLSAAAHTAAALIAAAASAGCLRCDNGFAG